MKNLVFSSSSCEISEEDAFFFKEPLGDFFFESICLFETSFVMFERTSKAFFTSFITFLSGLTHVFEEFLRFSLFFKGICEEFFKERAVLFLASSGFMAVFVSGFLIKGFLKGFD